MRKIIYGVSYCMPYDTVVVQKNYSDEIYIQSFENLNGVTEYKTICIWKLKTLKHGTS